MRVEEENRVEARNRSNYSITGSLSQEELNALLGGTYDYVPVIRTIKDLGNLLAKQIEVHNHKSFAERYVNIFQGPHITVTKELISEVYSKTSSKEPKAIVKVGDIEIIPINICPSCNYYHYDEEVQEIYNTSRPSANFISKFKSLSEIEILRKWRTENRTICCKKCSTYFQPTIAYSQSDATDPYLCKTQTIDTLKNWFKYITDQKVKVHLFSNSTKTIETQGNKSILYWDVFLKEPINGMEKCPKGILTNIARYTPYEDLEEMIAKENGVPVFEAFQFDSFCV